MRRQFLALPTRVVIEQAEASRDLPAQAGISRKATRERRLEPFTQFKEVLVFLPTEQAEMGAGHIRLITDMELRPRNKQIWNKQIWMKLITDMELRPYSADHRHG